MRRPLRLTLTLASWVLVLVAVVAIAVFAIGPHTGTYRTLTVLSGSMAPTFDPGDSIVVTPVPFDQLRKGDVITYRIPVEDRRVVTHRIVSIERAGGGNPTVVTKGDANATEDAWEAQLQGRTAWVMQGRIPKAGYVIHALRSQWLQKISIGAIVLFGLLALVKVWIPTKRDEERAAEPLITADVSTIDDVVARATRVDERDGAAA